MNQETTFSIHWFKSVNQAKLFPSFFSNHESRTIWFFVSLQISALVPWPVKFTYTQTVSVIKNLLSPLSRPKNSFGKLHLRKTACWQSWKGTMAMNKIIHGLTSLDSVFFNSKFFESFHNKNGTLGFSFQRNPICIRHSRILIKQRMAKHTT